MATRVEDLYALVPASVADAVRTRLRRKLPESDVEVRTPQPGRYRRLDERLHDDASGAGRGAALGAAGGAVIGAVVAAAVGVGIGPGIMITFAFAAFGALVGGMSGLQRTEPEDDDPAVDILVDDPQAIRLVVVRAPHQRDWARRLLERDFEGRVLETDAPLGEDDETAPEEEDAAGR